MSALAPLMASAMPITALPIAARILKQPRMTHSVIGKDLSTMLMVVAIPTTSLTGPLPTLLAGRSGTQLEDARETVARP